MTQTQRWIGHAYRSLFAALAIVVPLTFAATAPAWGQSMPDQQLQPAAPQDFRMAASIVLERMMDSYQKAVKVPVHIDLFDTGDPVVRRFIRTVNHETSDPGTVMDVNFDPAAKINGTQTAECLIQYNGALHPYLLRNYENTGVLDRQDILYYLTAHEFGHCMVFHQQSLGDPIRLSDAENELFADDVAIAFFMVNGKPESARRVIAFNRTSVSSTDDAVHWHPDELQDFYDRLSGYLSRHNARESVKSMLDIYHLVSGKTDLSR